MGGVGRDVDGIHGVRVLPLRVVETGNGAVLHMIRADDDAFDGFGEAYFSEVAPGAVKGWKLHRRMTQRLAVPVGEVGFYLRDGRPDSPTRGRDQQVTLGRRSGYALLVIPPGIWYAFRNPRDELALIANVPDLPHDPGEMERRDLDDPAFPGPEAW